MQYNLQVAVDALSLGSLYALAALGIGLIFGVMRLVNFAHGDLITAGAYALIIPSSNAAAVLFIGALPWMVMVCLIVGMVVLLAILMERFAFRPLRRADETTLLIASFALSYFLQYSILAIYGGRPKALDIGSSLSDMVALGPVLISKLDLVTIVVTMTLLGGLASFMRWSSFGVQIRAATQDFRMARMLGVRANAVIAMAFGISGLLAAVVSLLLVVRVGVLNPRLGIPLSMMGFVATVIGGMGSLLGCVVGGFLVGAISSILQMILPEALRPSRDAFVFISVILMLLLRPNGLIQTKSSKERV